MITPGDIRREHEEALASLTPEQCRGLGRLERARQLSHFNGRAPRENLQALFEQEARSRNEALRRAGDASEVVETEARAAA